ncbi:hypothetical protein GCM10010466_20670 [Planomonospora alba]|uniref:Methylated-DNA-[protein]-cysteine S-methyltransferase DNA binding domain-containing protein n=1 Tax=Planomonospora alba TaxID=161354 RepID=A0ABP6MXQ3_9ACTN
MEQLERPGLPSPYAERVLDLVERIPPGRVMSYGDVAEYLGEGGPRQVGRVMSVWGGGVPWWRVVHADGTPPPGHEQRCLAAWREEGTPLRGPRADMRLARWDGRGEIDSEVAESGG